MPYPTCAAAAALLMAGATAATPASADVTEEIERFGQVQPVVAIIEVAEDNCAEVPEQTWTTPTGQNVEWSSDEMEEMRQIRTKCQATVDRLVSTIVDFDARLEERIDTRLRQSQDNSLQMWSEWEEWSRARVEDEDVPVAVCYISIESARVNAELCD